MTFRGFIPSQLAMPSWHVLESLLWTMVVLIVVLMPLRVGALISNRAMVILGMLSYSLFLIHAPIVFLGLGPLVGRGIPVDVDVILRIVAFAAAFGLCLAMSTVTYWLVERPFLVRKARIDR